MRWLSRLGLTILLTGMVLSLPGCDGVDPVIKIGLVGPFEGRFRDTGYDVIYSARLAVREINEMGGIEGHRLALVALDDFGEPEMAQQTAKALTLDPGVVAVVGHWLPDTTSAAKLIYSEADLAFVATGEGSFGSYNPNDLPADFTKAYENITPFDEIPGPHAGPAYDAFGLVIEAMRLAVGRHGTISRENMNEALHGLRYEGLTGMVTSTGTSD